MTDDGRPPGPDDGRPGAPPPPPPPVFPPPVVPPPPPPPLPMAVPAPGYSYVPSRTSGFAVASLVLGIVWVFWIGSILAVIFGHLALSQIKRSMGALTGRGLAIAGLVLGYVGLASLVVTVALAATGVIDTTTAEECRADRATLTFAEEAYYSEFDHYTSERGLVGAGYLTDESDLHSIELFGGGPSSARDYEVVPERACD